MNFNIGDLVTRNSYNNDTIFRIIDIKDNVYYLKGINVRLCADSEVEDLVPHSDGTDIENETSFLERIKNSNELDRNEYFYIPGRVLHIDGDSEYLNRCLDYYKQHNIVAHGVNEKEDDIAENIYDLLENYNPNIVIITGHDAFYKKNGDKNDITHYKNTINFVKAVKEARRYEKSHDKLIIIAGACQSDYEELIKAGANFASSPKRINIHALDPAIIATNISLSDTSKDIDLKGILEQTKYGIEGMGGIKTKGTMYIGFPR